MSTGGLTENSAAIKIWRITGRQHDWQPVLAHTLRPDLTEKQHQAQYAENPPVRIIAIEEPYRQDGCGIGPVAPGRSSLEADRSA